MSQKTWKPIIRRAVVRGRHSHGSHRRQTVVCALTERGYDRY